MKITVKDLYELANGLGDLADKELPVGVSFKLSRNDSKVSGELKTVEEQRQKILEKDKEKQEDEFGELLKQEVEIDLQTIKLEDIGNASIKPRTLTLINKIIKEDDDE